MLRLGLPLHPASTRRRPSTIPDAEASSLAAELRKATTDLELREQCAGIESGVQAHVTTKAHESQVLSPRKKRQAGLMHVPELDLFASLMRSSTVPRY